MKKLVDYLDDTKFYRGTIIVLKDAHMSPSSSSDIKYCMISDGSPLGNKFKMLDLYRGIGGCICMDLEASVKGHVAVDKKGIKDWVERYLSTFFNEKYKKEWIAKIDDILYIEQLDDYFTQANRDLFM